MKEADAFCTHRRSPDTDQCKLCDRQSLAHVLSCGKRPRHYTAKRGSDEGGNPVNDAGLRLDIEVTAGFRVLILPPSIDRN